jgi:hypothetical protein
MYASTSRVLSLNNFKYLQSPHLVTEGDWQQFRIIVQLIAIVAMWPQYHWSYRYLTYLSRTLYPHTSKASYCLNLSINRIQKPQRTYPTISSSESSTAFTHCTVTALAMCLLKQCQFTFDPRFLHTISIHIPTTISYTLSHEYIFQRNNLYPYLAAHTSLWQSWIHPWSTVCIKNTCRPKPASRHQIFTSILKFVGYSVAVFMISSRWTQWGYFYQGTESRERP